MLKNFIHISLIYIGLCHNILEGKKIRTNPKKENFSYDVVIIGAGWAGLGAGNALISQGITNFQILEARDRIGGRSKTVYDFGENIPIDLGSEWVTGASNNPIYDIVLKNNIPSSKEDYVFDVYRPNGKKINRHVARALMSGYFESFSLYQKFRQKTDKIDKSLQTVMDDFKYLLPFQIYGRFLFCTFVESFIKTGVGGDASDMSLKYHSSNSPNVGGEVIMGVPNGGYKTIIDKYAESILPKVKLESKVTKIDYSTIPVNVTYEEPNGTLTFVQADKVILTIPIGVLRKGMQKYV